AVASGGDTGSATHDDADIAIAMEMRLGRVDPDPNAYDFHSRECEVRRHRRCHGIRRAHEDSEQSITFCIDDGPVVGSNRIAEKATVFCPQITVGHTLLPGEVGRSLDIAE